MLELRSWQSVVGFWTNSVPPKFLFHSRFVANGCSPHRATEEILIIFNEVQLSVHLSQDEAILLLLLLSSFFLLVTLATTLFWSSHNVTLSWQLSRMGAFPGGFVSNISKHFLYEVIHSTKIASSLDYLEYVANMFM